MIQTTFRFNRSTSAKADKNESQPIRWFVILLCFLGVGLFSNCREKSIPLPYAYPRITPPSLQPTTFHHRVYNLNFCYPGYAQIGPLIRRESGQIWFTLSYPYLKGTLYLSWLHTANPKEIEKVIRHQQVSIQQQWNTSEPTQHIRMCNASNASAHMYQNRVSASNPVQFRLSDARSWILLGTFEYDHAVQADSIRDVLPYVYMEIEYVLDHFKPNEDAFTQRH